MAAILRQSVRYVLCYREDRGCNAHMYAISGLRGLSGPSCHLLSTSTQCNQVTSITSDLFKFLSGLLVHWVKQQLNEISNSFSRLHLKKSRTLISVFFSCRCLDYPRIFEEQFTLHYARLISLKSYLFKAGVFFACKQFCRSLQSLHFGKLPEFVIVVRDCS